MRALRFIAGDRQQERHLLVAVDGCERSLRTVAFVADFFGGYPALRVTLLHILREPAPGHFPSKAERRAWVMEQEAEAYAILDRYRNLLAEGGVPEGRVDVLIEMAQATAIPEAILGVQESLQGCTLGIALD